MCGILGVSGALDAPGLQLSLAAIAHRGPDDCGLVVDEAAGIALGHTRLAILDLSPAGHQPMTSDDGQLVLVFNGEIYNFRELRAMLEAKGVAFRGHSDTEVLLRLYQAEGLAMLPRLNGIFAFALYDKRIGDLLVVRDALGVKPLYVSEVDGHFVFSSEIKAMLPLLRSAMALDEESLLRYLTYLWCPGDGTPLASVRKLSPGQWLRVKNGQVVERKQWFQPPMLRTPARKADAARMVVEVRDGLRAAVHRQLVADVPVGAFLSGGLDSSAIVAFAREQAPQIRCFTIATPGGRDAGETDDLPYAHRVARHLGVSLDVVEVDSARMAGAVERMVWQLDEPLADPAPLNVLFISQLARDQGIKVLLSGAGGDDLFTGYRRHVAVGLGRWWRWMPRRARTGLAALAGRLDQRTGLGRRAGKLFAGAGLVGDEYLASYFAWARPEAIMPLLHRDVRESLGKVRPEQPMLDFLTDMPKARPDMDRMLALEQRFFLADHNLTYTDKMSMAAGVEVRVPFLDMDLIELAASIPAGLKQRGNEGKWILKKAMEPYLPRDVIYRPKTGFGAPLRRWLGGELRELMGDLLAEESLRRRGLFDPGAVQRLIVDNESGHQDGAYLLFSLMCVEIWCRQFLDDAGKRSTFGSEME